MESRKFERITKVENVGLNDLIPYDKNPRKHGKNVDEIMKSIEKVGFTNPLIIDQNNRIVAGHGRHLAARRLGLTSAPCLRVELTDKEYHELLLADNKIAELSKWDKNLQQECIKILDNLGKIEVPGFTAEEIDKLFGHDPVVTTSSSEAGPNVERLPAPGDDDGEKPAPRLKELRVKLTAAQYKVVASKLRAIVKEHGLESEGDALLKALESFKGETKTIKRGK